MTATIESCAVWSRDLFEDEALEISIALTPVGPETIMIECGDGNLTLTKTAQGKLEVSGSTDKFMDRISTQMKEWIATSAVTDMGLWLAHFKRVAIEQYEDHAAEWQDSDNEDAKTDQDFYEEDNDGASRGCGPTQEFLAQYEAKRRWQAKEEQMRSVCDANKSRPGIAGRLATTTPGGTDASSSSSSSSSSISAGNLTSMDILEARKTEKIQNVFSPGASSIALHNDLWNLIKDGSEFGYTVDAVDDNPYCWSVKMHQFNENSSLITDLARLDDQHGYSYIELQLNFAMDLHPFFPPLVTIIRPRFEGFMLGKIATLPYLQLKEWNPTGTPKELIDKIRKDIEIDGRIDTASPLNSSPDGAYSYLEHLLLKLGLVAEFPPRVTLRAATQAAAAALVAQEKSDSVATKQRRIEDMKFPSSSSSSSSSSSNAGESLPHKARQGLGQDEDIYAAATASAVSAAAMATAPSSSGAAGAAAAPGVAAPGAPTGAPVQRGQAGIVWAKGTGYGHGTQVQWDPKAYIAAQAEKDRLQRDLLAEAVTEILKELAVCDAPRAKESMDVDSADEVPGTIERKQSIFRVIDESCLIPLLEACLLNDSFLEMERHAELYQSVFTTLGILCDAEELRPLLGKLDAQAVSLIELCKRLGRQMNIYFKPMSGSAISGSALAESLINDTSSELMLFIKSVLAKVSNVEVLFNQASMSVDKSTSSSAAGGGPNSSRRSASHASKKAGSAPVELDKEAMAALDELYRESLGGELQYKDHDDESAWTATGAYHYNAALLLPQASAQAQARTKRLRSEHADWSRSLPVTLSSSVWVRSNSARMDAVQAMISGPEDTPYHNGLFLFDAIFPEDYPKSPPKINLRTTGRGTVRFNPNLYNCGKVCLSLLGTWPGGGEAEKWNDTSTFLQVLVSIQSLILVPNPYFNEASTAPGHESHPGAERESERYNEDRRVATIRWAVLDQIKALPDLASSVRDRGFHEVIRRHFFIKRDEIKLQIARYKEAAPASHRSQYEALEIELLPKLDKLRL